MSNIVPTSSPFDALRHVGPNGAEFWSARDLMPLLGYTRWENFENPLNRAMSSMRNTGSNVEIEFHRSQKAAGQSNNYAVDYHLSREAAYLVAMNCDPNKTEVAEAQRYFAQQTRRAEVAQAALSSDPLLAQMELLMLQRREHLALVAAHDALIMAQGELEHRVSAIESSRADGTGFYTVLGWCALQRFKCTLSDMSKFGRKCTTMSAAMSLPVGTVPDPRYGTVNTYRLEVLQAVIGPDRKTA